MRAAALAVLLACVGATLLWSGQDRSRSLQWRILPDTGGPIKRTVVSLSSARRSSLRNADLVAGLVNALPDSVEVLALTNDAKAFEIQSGTRAHRLRLVDLPAALDFTIWPQDPFVVLRGPDNQSTLLLSAEFERADDAHMAEVLARYSGIELHQSELAFEGGNVLSDDEWIYLGANSVALNALILDESEVDIVRRFETEFGGPVLVVGRVPQPVAHLDMMLTPLGARQLIVADLRHGASLAAAALRQAPRTVREFEERFSAHLSRVDTLHESSGVKDGRPRASRVLDATTRAIDAAHAVSDQLDELADALHARGFTIHRIPLLFDASPRPAEATSRGVLDYPVLTYNNVLLEQRLGRRIVYLPQYGFPALDNAGQAAWRELGYEVRVVSGYGLSALHGGALRCTAKVLEREESIQAH